VIVPYWPLSVNVNVAQGGFTGPQPIQMHMCMLPLK
jgi:hypothetical protein